MATPYEIREQDGKWQVCVEDPPKWITCATEVDARAIAEAPVLEHDVDVLGKRGEELANSLDLAAKAVESSMDGDYRVGSIPASRNYASLAEKARGAQKD